MDGWILFGYWVLIFLGLLWVKRVTGRLRCNIFSAAIAAVIFIGIGFGFTNLMFALNGVGSNTLKVIFFLFWGFGLIPTASAMTLFLGNLFIPFFKVQASDIMHCTTYLTGWTFVALMLVSILRVLGFLLMGFFGGGMPRVITRASDDDYYYH
jgi:hypothetical protein